MRELSHYRGMPSQVRIGCFIFDVVVGGNLEHQVLTNSYGFMAPTLKRIGISEGLSPIEVANTFIHECMHAIHLVYGLMRDCDEASPTEEEYTTLTANGLCAFWQDNPKACAWWSKLLKIGGEN